MSSQGLDWTKIREEYAAKASPSELTTVKRLKDGSEIPIREIARTTPTPTNGDGANGSGRVRPARRWREYGDGSASSIPRHQIIAKYVEGMTVAQIAEHFGVHKSGIYKHLAAAAERGQVELRDDRRSGPGRPRRETCIRDHSLADGDPNVRIDKNGARHCRACERLRHERWVSKQRNQR